MFVGCPTTQRYKMFGTNNTFVGYCESQRCNILFGKPLLIPNYVIPNLGAVCIKVPLHESYKRAVLTVSGIYQTYLMNKD